MLIIKNISYLILAILAFISVCFAEENAAECTIKGISDWLSEPINELAYENWTAQERWVWDQVRLGKAAFLKKNPSEQWTEDKVLRPQFLKTILLHKPYCENITRNGVIIIGAWIKEPLNITNATILKPLALVNCRFESIVNLVNLKAKQNLSLIASEFKGWLKMDQIDVKNLKFCATKFTKEVILNKAKIAGYLDMRGANFKESLNMDGVVVKGSLFMSDKAIFEKDVILNGAKIDGHLDMSSANFKAHLSMNNIVVKGSLLMRDKAIFEKDVDLSGANIGDHVEMYSSTFKEFLNMTNIDIKSSLNMSDGANFENDIILRGATIGGQMGLCSSNFKGKLYMEQIEINSGLYMRDGSNFHKEVILLNAKIGGQLDLSGSIFESKLNMDGIFVGTGLMIRSRALFKNEVVLRNATIDSDITIIGSSFKGKLNMFYLTSKGNLNCVGGNNFDGPVNLCYAHIYGNMYLVQSKIKYLNLTSTRIDKELHLGSENLLPPIWSSEAKLILQNTHAGVLQDMPNSWPDELDIKGFTYTQLGGYGSETSMATRNVSWMKKWLEKQKQFSPQSYEQLAKILIKEGYPDKAIVILYADRERERSNSKLSKFIGLTLQKWIVGYGYYNFRSLYWIGFFIIIGWIIICRSGTKNAKKKIWSLIYSIDILLPIIELDKENDTIKLQGFSKYYFYVHKILGYVFTFYLIAGLSGLIQH